MTEPDPPPSPSPSPNPNPSQVLDYVQQEAKTLNLTLSLARCWTTCSR